ncbi:hypothetical protein C8Q80DRAFT_1269649 [Daedaleopsis nitida]|nr:hypothetical protein C8Q80DRAFT_1269649 [Daedaleopsis nitida]
MSSVLEGAFLQLAQLRVSVYANVASLALLLYDWQLTFGDEVNMVWKSNGRLSKILFLWIRYFGIATHIFGVCVYLIEDPPPATTYLASPNIVWWSVEFVFALRVWILYRRSRKLLVFLTFMYIASIVISVVILIKALVHVTPVAIPRGLGVSGCFSIVSETVFEPIILGVITTSTLCILTVYRTLKARRELTSSPLMTLFLRDGLVYYFSVNVVFLLNLMLFRFGQATQKNLFGGFLDAIPCMFGTRVLINILSLVHREFSDGGSSESAPPLSEPRFAPRGTSAIEAAPEMATTSTATATIESCGDMSVTAAIEDVLRSGDDLEKGRYM